MLYNAFTIQYCGNLTSFSEFGRNVTSLNTHEIILPSRTKLIPTGRKLTKAAHTGRTELVYKPGHSTPQPITTIAYRITEALSTQHFQPRYSKDI